jgi:hypothetical protein
MAIGLSQSVDLSPALCAGTVVGGAMFGDNLSILSDTTIAATRTQGCSMRDKFRLKVPMATETMAATKNRPGSNICSGMTINPSATVASTPPIALVTLAKAPANKYIIHMVAMLISLTPFIKW